MGVEGCDPEVVWGGGDHSRLSFSQWEAGAQHHHQQQLQWHQCGGGRTQRTPGSFFPQIVVGMGEDRIWFQLIYRVIHVRGFVNGACFFAFSYKYPNVCGFRGRTLPGDCVPAFFVRFSVLENTKDT